MEARINNEIYKLTFRENRLDEINLAGLGTVAKYDGDLVVNQMHAWAGFAPIMNFGQPYCVSIENDSAAVYSNAHLPFSVDYRLEGDKIGIEIAIENKTSQTLRAWRFTLPCLQFQQQPTGFFSQVPINELGNFTAHYYPGQFKRIGSAYLTTPELTVSAYRVGVPTHRYLFWLRSDYGDDPKRPLWYIDLEPIEPGGAVIRELVIEFADYAKPWQEMLGGYKENLPASIYTPNQSQIAGPYIQGIRANLAACTPDNPFGYTNTNWRFDTEAGAQAYRNFIADQAQRLNARGLIHWTLGMTEGEKQWGMYALNPTRIAQEVRSNFPLLFDQLGVPAGHLLRFDFLQAQNEVDPGITPSLDETTIELYRQMLRRSPMYFDSTGFEANNRETRLIHCEILRRLRERIPVAEWFVEHANDLTLGVAGGYGMLMKNPWEVYQIGAMQWEMLRWLRPESEWILGTCEGFGVDPSRWTTEPGEVIDGAAALGAIPLIQDWRLGELP